MTGRAHGSTSALAHLGQVSALYAELAQAYEAVALTAANAEAEHKRARAQTILRVKASEERMSHAEAETRAEADEHVAELYRQRVTTAAVADAHRARLSQLKEQVAVGRSFAVAERTADTLETRGSIP